MIEVEHFLFKNILYLQMIEFSALNHLKQDDNSNLMAGQNKNV